MITSKTTYASHLNRWFPLQPELHESCIHVKALEREKTFSFDCWIACFHCIVEAN